VASLSQGRTAAAQCGLFTHKSVPVIFEPPCSIEMHLGQVEWGHMSWINFPQVREKGQAVLNIVVNLWIL